MVLYDFRHRYQNATEARAALQNLLTTQPISQPISSGSTPATELSSNPNISPLSGTLPSSPSTSMKPKLPIRTFFTALFLGLCGGAASAVYVVSRYFPTAFAPTVVSAPSATSESSVPDKTVVEGGPGEEFTPEISGKGAADTDSLPTDTPEAVTAASAPVVVDYTPLKESLTAGQWKNADQITRDLLLSVAGRAGSTLRVEDLEQIPCKDLRTINQYWNQASQGRFGFTAQTKVWQNLVGKLTDNTNVQRNNSDTALIEFVKRTQWFYSKYSSVFPYRYGNLAFALNSPQGHLPAKVFLPVVSPNDSTSLKGAAILIPTLAQRVSFCERETTPNKSST